jgi:anaerobic magnesium-protoporphyrin IX monomethyl ester cyclase
MNKSRRIALVGREQPGDENLALRYLAAALKHAGQRPMLVPLNGPGSLPEAARSVLNARPCLVGLSIPDADMAIDALAFARLLRARGYQGHITAGGALATLARHEILARHTDIDSIIRHEGEVPLVALTSRVRAGQQWQDVPGVSSRLGDGLPAPVTDTTPLKIRPLHPDPLPRLLGIAMARLSASRGCPGRCRYCGPAALQQSAIDEGKRAGIDPLALKQAGVGGTRRRAARDVADEVAELYHDQKARFFHVLDDNLLAACEEGATHWLKELLCELEKRKVERTAWSLQVEPATISDEVIALLEELGMVRMAVGIEAVTPLQLRALGRPGDTTRNEELLCKLRDRGIVTVFNSLAVHSRSTPASVGSELEALSRLSGIHYDVLAMAVYPGTALHRTLEQEGRVTGGMLGLRFEPADPVVARFRAALIHLRLQGIGRYSPMVMAHDVAVNLALAKRFGLPGYTPTLQRDLDQALAELNTKRISAWRSALTLAITDIDREERTRAVIALVSRHGAELQPIWNQLQHIHSRMLGTETSEPARRGLMVASALAAGFTFCLVPAGCYRSDWVEDAGSTVESDAAVTHVKKRDAASREADSARDTGNIVASDAAGKDVDKKDAAIDSSIEASIDAVIKDVIVAPTPDAAAPDASGCSEQARIGQNSTLSDITSNCPMKPYNCSSQYGIALDAAGRVVDVVDSSGNEVSQEVKQCYLDALAGETFPCLAGDTVWQECVICLF